MFHLMFSLPWLIVATRFIGPLPWPWWVKVLLAVFLLFASQYHLFSRFTSGSVFAPEFPRPLVIAFNLFFGAIVLLAAGLTGAALSFAGVVVVVSAGSLGALLQHGVNLGDGMMLVATLAYAVYSTLLKKWQLRLPPLVLLYLQVLVAVVVLLPLYLFSAKAGLGWANIPLVLYACLLASMLAPLAWMHSVKTLGPSRTTLFFNLLPLITALIAAVVLKEELALYHLVGGLLTLGGVILSERWTTPVRRPQGTSC